MTKLILRREKKKKNEGKVSVRSFGKGRGFLD